LVLFCKKERLALPASPNTSLGHLPDFGVGAEGGELVAAGRMNARFWLMRRGLVVVRILYRGGTGENPGVPR